MSLRNLLRQRQAAAVPSVPCPTPPERTEKSKENQKDSPGSLSSSKNAKGKIGKEIEEAINDPEPPAPEADIDLLLNNLRFDFIGAPLHDIDDELAGMIRLAMLPMGRRPRAELAALIDDHLAQPEGRERVQALLEERLPGTDEKEGERC